jgi:PKD repeat protein
MILGLILLVVSPAIAATTMLNKVEIYDNNVLIGYHDMSNQTYPNPISVLVHDVITIKVQSTAGSSCAATLTLKDPNGKIFLFLIPANSKNWNEVTFIPNWDTNSKSFDLSINDCQNVRQTFTGDTSFKITPTTSQIITATAGSGGIISPLETTSIASGGNQILIIAPTSRYPISGGKVDEASKSAITTYTITAIAGMGGTINPGTVSVPSGGDQEFTITPDSGYRLLAVTVDGYSFGAPTIYWFTNVVSAHTISATFTKTYTITATAGPGGAISPPGAVSVDSGTNQMFAIDPDPGSGFTISNVYVDGVSKGAIDVYTFTNVVAAHTISVIFGYPITATTGTGGTISPGTVSIPSGGSQTFTILPNSGYAISNVYVDGVSKGAIGAYTFTNVVAAHTISVTFVQLYTITAIAGTGGTISPGTVSVPSGGEQIFTITPDSGCRLLAVTVDGYSFGAPTSYTFTNVVAAHTISATFTKTYTITATAGPGGAISPPGAVSVDSGKNQMFVIGPTPGQGFTISNVYVDGVSKGAINTYTFTNVVAAHTISATFGYPITVTTGSGGTISPGTVSVPSGGSQTFTILPNSGYAIVIVYVDKASKGAIDAYTFTNVVAAHTISALFTEVNVPPTPTFKADFTVSPMTGTAPLIVKCTDKSIGNPTWFLYDFGDGSIATGPNPVHTYARQGTYSVSLTVKKTQKDGTVISNTTTKKNYITINKSPVPVVLANFSASPVTGIAPFKVQFNDNSVGKPNYRTWDFGDQGISQVKNPAHTYRTPGNYSVTLKVWKTGIGFNVAGNTTVRSGLITVT